MEEDLSSSGTILDITPENYAVFDEEKDLSTHNKEGIPFDPPDGWTPEQKEKIDELYADALETQRRKQRAKTAAEIRIQRKKNRTRHGLR
ncbi:MAG: hypothetical protein QF442_02810 [Candidatus Peribacteraceae bacterium]|jgi:hypothetical protein|nr:hypothetical protein [Candidatus Peribacteraceae bacterium]